MQYIYYSEFRVLQVRQNGISLRKRTGGIAHLHTSGGALLLRLSLCFDEGLPVLCFLKPAFVRNSTLITRIGRLNTKSKLEQ